jgi:putative hydrolase of the HAD superfamily
MIRGVLFDLDNTLLDFMHMKRVAIDAAVSAMVDTGMPVPHEEAFREIYQLYEQVGIEHQEIFQLFLKQRFGEVQYKWLAAAIIAYRRARDGVMVTYPHVRATLVELLRRGLKLAVISDAPRLNAWLRLCQLDLHHAFDPVVTFEDTGHRKPSPMPFERALERMALKPSEVIMIGDWPERDMVGAKQLGIRTVFARYGDVKGVTKSGADFEIDDIGQLVQVLDCIEFSQPLADQFEPIA